HSTPAIGADGAIYVGSMDGRLHAVDAFGGVKWTFPAGAGIDSSPNISDDGIVYIASPDGWLYGIDSGVGAGLANSPWPRFRKDTGGTGVVSGPPALGKKAAEQAADAGTPLEFRLGFPHPNPFNAVTAIEYTLPRDAHVRLSVYNAAGQRFRILADARQAAGSHTVSWDAGDAPSGLYFCRLESPAFTATRKLLLVK
ncbi:MAG: PQQ-binding-like beta-propeller repeat protein, partial [Candidatus Latescibacteria bacterium]|nr:PQQ-binding-like beta-propeller repeat protein [Candidatus Latescibacterota bacterium]